MRFEALCNEVFCQKLITKKCPAFSCRPRMDRLTLRVMKLTAIFLMAAGIQVSANGYSQFSISEKNAPLSKVFKVIEKQSDYVFFYDYKWLEEARTVSIKMKNAALSEVLDMCFQAQPLTYSIIGKTIVVKPKDIMAITKGVEPEAELIKFIIVTGKVTDATSNKPWQAPLSLQRMQTIRLLLQMKMEISIWTCLKV
jgi:hypothetical protein